jgi:exopolysaccharide biosynthesis polyprenyl glycosylphosphotransferase
MQITNMRKKFLASGTRFLDISMMSIALIFALYYNAPTEYPNVFVDYLSYKIKLINVIGYFILIIAWNRLFYFFGLYEVRRFGNILREWSDILKAVTLGSLLLAAVGLLLGRDNINNSMLITFWMIGLILTIGGRTIVRIYLHYLRLRGRNLRFIVFVGSSTRVLNLAQKVLSRQELGFRLLGFVDEEFESQKSGIPESKQLCSLKEFPDFLEHHVVDEVFIALPIKTFYEEIKATIKLCEELGVICRIPSDWFEFQAAKTSAFDLDGTPVLTIYTGSHLQVEYLWLKRSIDLILSVAGIFVFSPIILAIALMVKYTTKGPVFFKQTRVGYNKRRFNMLKFRTMVTNAEELQKDLEHLNEADGAAFKIDNDPRITPLGKFLRKTSLDELPQMFNILKGEMSLVGPRPLPLRDVDEIDKRWQKRRFSMRPGITCLWQVSGRNNLMFHEWMKLDLEYIDSWSISLDFRILLQTIPAVIKATGK